MVVEDDSNLNAVTVLKPIVEGELLSGTSKVMFPQIDPAKVEGQIQTLTK